MLNIDQHIGDNKIMFKRLKFSKFSVGMIKM